MVALLAASPHELASPSTRLILSGCLILVGSILAIDVRGISKWFPYGSGIRRPMRFVGPVLLLVGIAGLIAVAVSPQ
jgi:hypothetical protein